LGRIWAAVSFFKSIWFSGWSVYIPEDFLKSKTTEKESVFLTGFTG